MKRQGVTILAWAVAALFCLCARTDAQPAPEPPPGDSVQKFEGASKSPESTGAMQIEGGYLEYDRDRRIAVLKDGAHIEYDDLKLWADNVHDDLGHDQIYAQGAIEMWRGKDKYQGDSLGYNYKTRRGTLRKLHTRRGVEYVVAEKMDLLPDRIVGYEVSTTTCDRSPPHFRIQARKMTILPGDKMIMENVRFRMNEKTWFRLPRYVVDLKSGEAMERFFVKPGYTAARGFTLKTAYQFWGNEYLFGKVYYNPSQFEGTDFGGTIHYKFDDKNPGEFDFSRHESNLIHQQASRYQLNQRSELPWAMANLNLLLTDTTFGNLGTDSEMNLGASLARTFPGWSTQLSMEKRFDLSDDNFRLAPVQFLETTPKFTFAETGSTDLFGSGVGLSVDGNVAHYREVTAQKTTAMGRAETSFNVSLPPARLGDVQEINSSIRQTEDLYENGQMRHFFSYQANSFERYTDSLNSGFNYVFQDAMGDASPFSSFDLLPPKLNLLTGFLRFGDYDRFSGTLFQVGHDFTNGQYQNASSNFVYHTPIGGQRFVSLGLTPFYDLSRDPTSLDSLRIGSVSTNFRVASGDRWSHALITNYDTLHDRMQSITERSGFLLNDKTRLDLDSNLSLNTLNSGYDLTKLNLGITRDFHDFEGRLRWNAVQQEIFFEFYLKYASTRRIGLGVNYGDTPDLVPTFGPGGAGSLSSPVAISP
ncbi:MAG: hypothetical protein HY303_00235 [Candidatus Wallbacteria bacterium]|nr:hypothetical protein [Candidatus Wallbacteria bacterium]